MHLYIDNKIYYISEYEIDTIRVYSKKQFIDIVKLSNSLPVGLDHTIKNIFIKKMMPSFMFFVEDYLTERNM